jgi:hypothetical protein
MSSASYGFAELLLGAMEIKIEVDAINTDGDSKNDPPPYSWTVKIKRNKRLKKGEHQGTPGACDWFRKKLIGANAQFDLKVVTGKPLPTLKANKMSTSGKGDVVIGKKEHLDAPVSDAYEQAYGLIELKTSEYDLKPAQNVLELTALARVSRMRRNVAVLATDCAEKWELCYFKDYSTIKRTGYTHGSKCWEDFKKLLDDADTRKVERPPRNISTLPLIEELDDQNLEGFDVEEDGKRKAVERQAMLENLANQLGELYGERPIVPIWARAEATCPEYYS